MKFLLTIVIAFFGMSSLTGCSVFGIRGAEVTDYNVLIQSDSFEIRRYKPYLTAQTNVKGDYESARSEGFKILANFIFGDNKKAQDVAMTAPVEVQKNPESQKIKMTAPVTVQAESDNLWTVTFTMPSKYTKESLPVPNDDRINIVEVPEKFVAVNKYTGTWSKEVKNRKAQELIDWLNERSEYKIKAEPSFAGYDPPWTLPFLRRNEILIDVEPT